MTKLEFGDLVAKMPEGFDGFLKTWGLSQFADLIEVEVRKNVIAEMQLTNEQARAEPLMVGVARGIEGKEMTRPFSELRNAMSEEAQQNSKREYARITNNKGRHWLIWPTGATEWMLTYSEELAEIAKTNSWGCIEFKAVLDEIEPVSHNWDESGERCLNCGDKDWMADPSCSQNKLKTRGDELEEIKDKWKIVDGDCREVSDGLITHHVDAFNEGFALAIKQIHPSESLTSTITKQMLLQLYAHSDNSPYGAMKAVCAHLGVEVFE
jgi:hypothetical protein